MRELEILSMAIIMLSMMIGLCQSQTVEYYLPNIMWDPKSPL